MAPPGRARWILLLLLQGGGTQRYNKPIVGRTRLVKELFLLKKAFGINGIEYEFLPYWYGPFSPEILADLEDLKQESSVIAQESPGGDRLSLSPAGVKAAQRFEAATSSDVLSRIRECKERFNSMPFEELITYVYARWPEYTTRALQSPSKVLEEFRRQARRERITEADIDRAIAEYRARAS